MFDGTVTDEKLSNGVRVRRMADAACAKVGFAKADEILETQIRSDETLTEYAISFTAHREVQLAIHARRAQITGTAEPDERRDPKTYSEPVRDRCLQWAGKYLGWPMSTRKTLGESTVDEVASEAEMYEAKASGHARQGRFMRLVATRMKTLKAKPNEPVGKVLDDNGLKRLMTRAKKG